MEDQLPEYAGSFVYVLGSCYSLTSQNGLLKPDAYRGMLNRLRNGLPPVTEDYSGNYAVVAFDAQSKRVAVQPDPIGILGIYFAIRVANYCESALDGHSVISMMRGTHIPFGRTLFAGVRRLMRATYVEVALDAACAKVNKAAPLYVPTLDTDSWQRQPKLCLPRHRSGEFA